MPYQISWDDAAHTILRIDITGESNWGEPLIAQKEVNALVEGTGNPCTMILNLSTVTRMPPNALSQAQKIMTGWHPHIESVVMVGKSSFIKKLVVAAFRVYRSIRKLDETTLFAADLIEARQLIQEHRRVHSPTHDAGS